MSERGVPGAEAETIAVLRSADAAAQLAALERLAAEARPLGETLALAVVDCLGAPAKGLQRRAADVLRLADAEGRPAVLSRLHAAACGTDVRLRWGATFALAQIGVLDAAMVPPLLEALASRDGDQRWAAAGIMVACARAYRTRVLPELLAALGAGGAELRKMVLYVLRDLVPGTPEVTAAFLAGLRDPDVGVRLAALSGLARLKPVPEGASALVLEVLRHDPDPGLRRAAVHALGHVGRGVAGVREILDEAAVSGDAGLRRAAARARRHLQRAEGS